MASSTFVLGCGYGLCEGVCVGVRRTIRIAYIRVSIFNFDGFTIYTSWNATFNLTYLFTMPKVQVISAPHTE